MKIVKLIYGAALLGAGLALNSAMSADPASAPAGTNAPGRNPASSLTPADNAEIVPLNDFPPYKSGLGDGNYSIGPDYAPAPEETARENVPHGKVIKFTMDSSESKFYPGVNGPFQRAVTVYVPSQYVPGTPAPVIVSADAYGGGKNSQLSNILDNMIADHRLPVIVAVMIANGGKERSMEYDTVSAKYADYVEAEVLPRAEKEAGFIVTKNPDARMTFGGSSGGAVAFTMAWFHPELYHLVLMYSGSFANLKTSPDAPHRAWGYHENVVPNSPAKPLRVWMEVSEHDVGAATAAAGMRNWIIANARMAADLKAKGYHYQFVYAKNAGHTDGKVTSQTLPQALEYLWKDYLVDSTKAPGGPKRGGSTMSEADKAEVAKLANLPEWKPGDGDGDYFIGPSYASPPERKTDDSVPKGRIERFTMNLADSKFFTGAGMKGATPTRKVAVYIPSQYVPGTPAPLIVTADSYGGTGLGVILDNMIAAHRLPAIIAVMIANGGGDAGGSERGLEYNSVNGKNAEFIEAEVLPKVEKDYGVTLSKDPDARMTMGGSSGGASAFTMAWFHPELYHRVIAYSGTFVNQNHDNYPHGAWSYHESLIPNSPVKPLRLWLEVGEHDIGATSASSGFHNWVIANIRMAKVLKDKGYHYQFIYAENAGHTDHKVIDQTLPQALEYVWKGYPIAPAK